MLFRFSISFISAAVIGYEILLMRLLSIVQWHHFAYMIISLALLGFGASGTFLTLARRHLLPRFYFAYVINAVLFGLFSIIGFALAQRIPFNALEIVWDPRQILYLLALYLLLFVPFFCAANCIGLAFYRFRDRIGPIYRFDLMGAAMGAVGIAVAMNVLFPPACLRTLGVLPFFAVAMATLDRELKRPKWLAGLFAACGLIVLFVQFDFLDRLHISEYKGLRQALQVPGAEIIEERSTPLGYISVVKSPTIPFRHAPGLSLTREREIPEQLGIFTDGDSLSVIARYSGNTERLAYLDGLSQALPYHLMHNPRVLILGAGGGADVLLAIYHSARGIDAVELNPEVVDLVKDTYARFGGNIYAAERVKSYVSEARGFVTKSEKKYDLIQLSLLDSFSAASAGLYALSESYLYTVEAFQQYLRHLEPGGMLAITRWLKIPPRDSLKLLATAIEALNKTGVSHPEKQLALIRGWKTTTLLIKNGQFAPNQISAIRRFCRERGFDVAYYPGMEDYEANRFNRLDEPYLFDGATALLSAGKQDFITRYKYQIAPATDERPYFFNFFKWSTLPEVLRLKEKGGAPLIEWGYPVLAATLVQATVLSIVLIILPLWVLLRAATRRQRWGSVFFYFVFLGLAFLFIEIAFIQRFILFLSHPIYAIAVVLASFLFFAGLGSGYSARLAGRIGDQLGKSRPKAAAIAVTGIMLLAVIYLLILPALFRELMGLSDAAKIVISVILIAPLAFFMGMPFPLGLSQVGDVNADLIPWAWGINGCASVISPIVATILAIHLGFTVVVASAMMLYLLAAVVLRRV